jgi:hypothetical protein
LETPQLSKPISRLAAGALALANLIVLVVAGFQKWGYELLLATVWWETVIIGFYNVGRIVVVFLLGDPLGKRIGFTKAGSRLFFALAVTGFFVLEFGGFALGLGLFVMLAPAAFTVGGGHDLHVALVAAREVAGMVLPVVAVLFVSHGISFVQNFIRRREYRRGGILMLLFWPYARLALMLPVVLLGFAATRVLPVLARTTIFTVAVILLKLFVDFATHRFEHRRQTVHGQANRD